MGLYAPFFKKELIIIYNMTDIGNCNDKRRILKDIDKDFDICFSAENEQYIVTHKGFPFQKIKWDGFDREVVNHIKKMVWLNNNGNVIDEIDKNNKKVDKDKENKINDMCREMAKDLRKPLINDYVYGG